MKSRLEAERRHESKSLPKKQTVVYHYDKNLLELARQRFERTGDFPLNPFIADAPLALADMQWCRDFPHYLNDHEYRYQVAKRQLAQPKAKSPKHPNQA